MVARTEEGDKVLFVKQAGKLNKRAWQEKHEKIYVAQGRMDGEYTMLTLLSTLWGKDYVPPVYFYDKAQHIMVMGEVGRGSTLLVEEFQQDHVHPELGETLGMLLGKLHAATYKKKEDCCKSTAWRKLMHAFVSDWYLGIGILKYVPQDVVRAFWNEAQDAPRAWVWGDAVYRNILVGPGAHVAMVDFDHAFKFDPAFDGGVLLAHWMWMGEKNTKLHLESEQFVQNFWKGYGKEFESRGLTAEVPAIKKRALRWAGQYLVSRTDGKSGSYFTQWPAWEKNIRELGITLFLQK